jgi:hypothetical protein
MEHFDRFFNEMAHLFTFADHSVPIGTINAENTYSENFQVPLVYFIRSNTLLSYDLKQDPNELSPVVLRENLTYKEFLNKHMCERFFKPSPTP